MEQRPWYERLFDRDNSAGPIVVVVLLFLPIALVLLLGPILDRIISRLQAGGNGSVLYVQ